jgi:hypothetical protein
MRRELNDEAIGGGLPEHRDQEWESVAASGLVPGGPGRTVGAALAIEEARKRDAEIEDAHPPDEPK